MHLHLGLNSKGLDLGKLQAHYTVMDQGLGSPCADRNMVAVSNPCRLDDTLTDKKDRIVVHAYSAGNEPYENWAQFVGDEGKYNSIKYTEAKEEAVEFLYRSTSKGLGISVEEIKSRAEVALTGTPLTHKRYLSRHEGTYGLMMTYN